MVSPQMNGMIFEKEVHEFLSKTKHDILLNETQIRKIDNTITAIDHLLIANNVCYCFQDKRLKTNISNSDFNHFVKCVEKVATKISKEYNNFKVYAVYLSFTDFSSIANNNLRSLEEENAETVKDYDIEYIKINDQIKDNIIKKLHYFLHSNNVFLYDTTGDCIML